ncbi:hypothetical protein AU210_007152 [Fusarium oxysporum f. sp. radicis-cucumerinum]|uniref:Uncharacterized protein n=1 Tax=Fusarium oxysporum f. sp. radicis-cucumerinum TaxID=327505 RepID=A0A2H3H9Q8_FUSOX|nr:hypothetical protein AU210_007152 [Fusarium oxysporum f. sp. radicis-cucumerinum]
MSPKQLPPKLLADMPAMMAASRSNLQALVLILSKELGRTIDICHHPQITVVDVSIEDAFQYFEDQAGTQFLGLAAYFITNRGLESATNLLCDIFDAQQWRLSDGKLVEAHSWKHHIGSLLNFIGEKLEPHVGPSGQGHIQTGRVGMDIRFELRHNEVKISGEGKLSDFNVKEERY